MYLTKLDMDICSASIQQGLRNYNDMHRNIQQIFKSSRVDSGILYRIQSRGSKLFAYVMSPNEVTIDMVDGKSGFKVLGSRSLESLESTIEEGKKYRFDIVAYPSKKVSFPDSKNSKRVFLYNEPEQREWFERKAVANGFSVDSMIIDNNASISVKKSHDSVILKSAHIYGILTVENRSEFINCWNTGIGPEKAYGMGMLLIHE